MDYWKPSATIFMNLSVDHDHMKTVTSFCMHHLTSVEGYFVFHVVWHSTLRLFCMTECSTEINYSNLP